MNLFFVSFQIVAMAMNSLGVEKNSVGTRRETVAALVRGNSSSKTSTSWLCCSNSCV